MLCTHDLFRHDDEGFLYFVGRSDDIIKSRGEKVSPREVENVLYEMPEIVEAAVIGVPDAILGQAIKALVVTQHGDVTEKDVLRHCRAKLEDYMVPKFVEFVDQLPKSANGKIQKPAVEREGVGAGTGDRNLFPSLSFESSCVPVNNVCAK